MTDVAGSEPTRARSVAKSPTAFRTISEVSVDLDVPQHVLRFWETKFPQIKPLKRGGGRRYYRPDDVELLRRIQHLLYKEGYTIKGVQRLLKESRGVLPAAGEGPAPPAQVSGLFDLPADTAAPEPDDEPDVEGDDGEAPMVGAAADTEAFIPEAKRVALEEILSELEGLRAMLRTGRR